MQQNLAMMRRGINKTLRDCSFRCLWPHEEHVCTVRGAKYFAIFVNYISRKVWVYMTKSKGSGLKNLRTSEHL